MSSGKLYTIVGAGAIGGILGAHLIKAGHRVHFIEQNAEHVARIKENGLRLTGTRSFTVHPELITTPDEPTDSLQRVLLAVKSGHTLDALASVAPRLTPDGFIVSLQNGLEEYKIAAAVGKERTVGAFLTFGGHYLEPGVIFYGGRGSFLIGEPEGFITPRVKELQADFSVLQPVEATDNIFGFLWGKLAIGAAYFATALVDADVPDIYTDAELRSILGKLVAEVARAASAVNVVAETIDGFDPKMFAPTQPQPEAISAAWNAQTAYWMRHGQRRTGIWRDLAVHRRETEVDELLGPIVKAANSAGVETPYLKTLITFIHEAERSERAFDRNNLIELANRVSSESEVTR